MFYLIGRCAARNKNVRTDLSVASFSTLIKHTIQTLIAATIAIKSISTRQYCYQLLSLGNTRCYLVRFNPLLAKTIIPNCLVKLINAQHANIAPEILLREISLQFITIMRSLEVLYEHPKNNSEMSTSKNLTHSQSGPLCRLY